MDKNKFTNDLEKQILDLILDSFKRPEFISNYEKENKIHFEKLINEFEKDLNNEQKENLNNLFDLKTITSGTEKLYGILYGMKFFCSVLEIINNPISAINSYESTYTPMREIFPLK